MTDKLENDHSLTGTAYDFERATTSLTGKWLSTSKKVTIVRHGLSSWNEEGRIQVCCLLSYFLLQDLGMSFTSAGFAFNSMNLGNCFSFYCLCCREAQTYLF